MKLSRRTSLRSEPAPHSSKVPSNRQSGRAVRFGLACAVVAACSGSSGGDGGSVACTGTNLTATAANNYSFSSTLTCPPIAVAPKTEFITPVPGGVGPMTIAMLMHNTVRAAQMRHGVA